MTKEQLDTANNLVERIKRLQKILDMFRTEASGMDESLVRMTGVYIINDRMKIDFSQNINQGELLFLIEAFTNEIARLEQELAKV